MAKTEKDRKRYRTVAFRCSDAELAKLNKRIEFSGLQKQDYLIKSTLDQHITVIGNRVLFEKLDQTLNTIRAYLERIEPILEPKDSFFADLKESIEFLDAFQEESD